MHIFIPLSYVLRMIGVESVLLKFATPLLLMFSSDSLYHRLFSHPQMVHELMREFVPDAVATGVDFSGLRRINAKFHVDRPAALRREGDVIWKLPTREGADSYLYLLIEFQSETDSWMAVRTQVYLGLLYQQIIQENKLKRGARLPPLMLLVLYNGERRWNAPTGMPELIELPSDSSLWHWQPQVRYCLLDMGAFAGEDLARSDSLAALLFRLEQRQSQEGFCELIDALEGWFRGHPEFEPMKQLFDELVQQAIVSLGVQRPIPNGLVEKKTVLATHGEYWKQQWRAEVRAEVQAEVLVGLLVRRFGPLEPALHARIHTADPATIASWLDRVIDAPDLRSVFETAALPESHHSRCNGV
jgi:hypothetical protein